LRDVQRERPWIESLARAVAHQSGRGKRKFPGDFQMTFFFTFLFFFIFYSLRLVHLNFLFGYLGYGTLIRAYIQFLNEKFSYHAQHPEFNGNFDYEEYVTLKGIEDPNEG